MFLKCSPVLATYKWSIESTYKWSIESTEKWSFI